MAWPAYGRLDPRRRDERQIRGGPWIGHDATKKGDSVALLSYARESTIRRSPEDVFDFLTDLRHERDWNPSAKHVEKLTEGPIRVGTRFRAQWSGTGPSDVEVIRHDRPKAWATRSAAMGIEVIASGSVSAISGGSRYVTRLELRPHGIAWLLAPLAKILMERGEDRNMRLLREALEAQATPSSGMGEATPR